MVVVEEKHRADGRLDKLESRLAWTPAMAMILLTHGHKKQEGAIKQAKQIPKSSYYPVIIETITGMTANHAMTHMRSHTAKRIEFSFLQYGDTSSDCGLSSS